MKTCPFCGASTEFIKFDTGDCSFTENDYMIRCTGKLMHTLDYVASKDELIKIWDQRINENN